MRGRLHVVSLAGLEGLVEALALSNLIRLERLLKAHADFETYLEERDA